MRFSILTLLGLVAFAALCCFALLNPSHLMVHITYAAVFALLCLSLLAALFLRGKLRVFLIGVSVCGLPFLHLPTSDQGILGTSLAARYLYEVTWQYKPGQEMFAPIYFDVIFHCIASTVFAFIGGCTARYFYALRQKQNTQAAEQPQ